MPIAAVPRYLANQDFSTASPALRFGMYLRLWGIDSRSRECLWTTHDVNYRTAGRDRVERAFKDENKTSALRESARISDGDRRMLDGLSSRQTTLAALAACSNPVFTLDALSIAPFTTGLGNEHPLENGFAFLNPYGLPYLPGSGVKGVLRQAARELAAGGWDDPAGWDDTPRYPLMTGGPEHRKAVLDKRQRPVMLTSLDVLFGRETPDGDSNHVRGALTFWDVIPQIPGDSLAVEIMTPHQSHYYQQKAQAGSTTPHESGQPNPISFLTVPPGARFVFHVQCDLAHLRRLAPALAADERWRTLLDAAFRHAFDWLGFGAKTAVGYGAMHENPAAAAARAAERARIEAQRQAEEDARQRAALPPDARLLAELDLELARLPQDPRTKTPIMQQTSRQEWPALLDRLAAQAPTLDGLANAEREALATAIKRRLSRHFKVEGKADKAMKQVLSTVRGA
ncbi:MAG: type III-B CRISPR module RAMP protein Cmr6 [Thauera sp.]|nr:type III-B CRISPR module RAMP protein Cmr6 [Thauera sp.]